MKNYIYIVLIILLFSACSNNDFGSEDIVVTDNPSAGKTISGEVTFNNTLVANTLSGTRTSVTFSKETGITYNWKEGTVLPLYIYAEQNGIRKTFEEKLVVKSGNLARFTLTLPDGLDPSKGNLKIATALGKQDGVDNGAYATGIDLNGRVKIVNASTINVSDSTNINIPLYSTLQEVYAEGDVKLDLKVLGSWAQIIVNSGRSLSMSEFVINSDAVCGKGTLDLSQNIPSFTRDATESTYMTYTLLNSDIISDGSSTVTKKFLTWMMPITGTGTQVVSTDRASSAYATMPTVVYINDLYSGASYNTSTKRNYDFMGGGRCYTFTIDIPDSKYASGLKITEYCSHSATRKILDWIEITNQTGRDVNLSEYYLVRAVAGAPDDVAGAINLGELATAQGVAYSKPNHSKTILPTGASFVITGSLISNLYFSVEESSQNMYQAVCLGGNHELLKAFTATKVNNIYYDAYFITHNGTNIKRGVVNDIVDNFGRYSNGTINRLVDSRTYITRLYFGITPGTTTTVDGITDYDYSRTSAMYTNASKNPVKDFDNDSWTYIGKVHGLNLGVESRSGLSTFIDPTVANDAK